MGKPFRRDADAGRRMASLLAVIFMITGGGVTCAAIVLSSAQQAAVPLAVCFGLFFGLAVFVWRLAAPEKGRMRGLNLLSLFVHEPADPVATYRLKRKTPPPQLGTNRPPEVADLRDISETYARWVPGTRASTATAPRLPFVDDDPDFDDE